MCITCMLTCHVHHMYITFTLNLRYVHIKTAMLHLHYIYITHALRLDYIGFTLDSHWTYSRLT